MLQIETLFEAELVKGANYGRIVVIVGVGLDSPDTG